jgi:hypothetical protein
MDSYYEQKLSEIRYMSRVSIYNLDGKERILRVLDKALELVVSEKAISDWERDGHYDRSENILKAFKTEANRKHFTYEEGTSLNPPPTSIDKGIVDLVTMELDKMPMHFADTYYVHRDLAKWRVENGI